MHIPRPQNLYALFASTRTLPGIGSRIGAIMDKRIGPHLIDLLRHLPVSLIDRRASPRLADITESLTASFEVVVTAANIPPPRTSRPARITVETDDGAIQLIYFHARADYLKQILPIGERRLISGRVELFQGQIQMPHPDYVLAPDKRDQMPDIEPVYPLSAGLKARLLRKAIEVSCTKVPILEEWISKELIARFSWPDFRTALLSVHHPQHPDELSPHAPARVRLAYDELLANQIALRLLRRRSDDQTQGRAIQSSGALKTSLINNLSFPLTTAQRRVMEEISTDMQSPVRMLRLLQGDVGAGKTVVALGAMLDACEAGYQSALLVPTEVLAKQHHASLNKMLAPLGLTAELLTGGMRSAERREILSRLASAETQIIVGTHALLSEDVEFASLGLAVVDEQHRFGVRQRLVLGQKGGGCDVLVMTATPIPRTLAMTAYGDLTVSVLDEKPANRLEITTALVSQDRVDDIIGRLKTALDAGQRAYWICPLVEETETSDVTTAEDRHRLLSTILPQANPSLAHGQMKPAEREEAMASFASGASQLLVATTVIEVGVDVPEASIIIIEHAERFGLAQLHQLRGRVGRGDIASSCILLYRGPLTQTAEARLKIMRQTNDGFVIAEEDLRQRGPGEVLGQRQSGLPEFVLADLNEHAELLASAQHQADQIMSDNPELAGEQGQHIKTLLSLFERDVAVQFLGSG